MFRRRESGRAHLRDERVDDLGRQRLCELEEEYERELPPVERRLSFRFGFIVVLVYDFDIGFDIGFGV